MSEFSWKKFVSSLLKKWLKYTGPTTTMGLSLSLSLYLFLTPQKVVEIFQLKQQVAPELLVRWFLPGWLLFLGLVIAHLWYIRISSKTSNLWKLHKKITLPIGNYYDLKDENGENIIRITLKEISEQDMPPPYEYPKNHSPSKFKTEVAIINFDPEFVSHGAYVKPIERSFPYLLNECQFAMSKNAYSEEDYSVFFFRTDTTTGYGQFFRCFVSHINAPNQEVEMDMYFLQTKKL